MNRIIILNLSFFRLEYDTQYLHLGINIIFISRRQNRTVHNFIHLYDLKNILVVTHQQ